MRVPFIELKGQHRKLRRRLAQEIRKIFDSQQFILKDRVLEIEEKIAAYTGAKHAIGVASGTDAIYLALAAEGVGHGDEVLTTPFSFFATAGAISRTGARPVFADIDPRTFNLDPGSAAKKISKRTKAILPVHLFGLPCDMDPILTLAHRHSLTVVEDAAQSFGAIYKGKKTGAIGDAGCFSFYPTKSLGGAGDGGMVVTSSKKLADEIRVLRDHGQTRKYYHERIGVNSRLDELQAAVLRVKLEHLDFWNRKRREHALYYNKNLEGLPLQLPRDDAGGESIYHLYSVLTDERAALSKYLTDRNIGNGVYYPLPLHLQPCYRDLGYQAGDLPISESVASRILSLPMFPELSSTERKTVVRAVRSFFESRS